jgi:hypothetical protein
MSTTKSIRLFTLLFFTAFSVAAVQAQRGYVRSKVRSDMEKKYGDSSRKKGKSELEKITYENDKRYKDPVNRVQATIGFEDKELNKKGEVKKTSITKIVFGKTGECMVMDEGTKNETWMIFNYADKANYMVNVKDKSAMKMPLINLQKMAENAAKKEAERAGTDSKAGWKATGEKQVINGYNCTKFIYTYDTNPHYATMDAWVSTQVKMNLGDNYMFGARLNSYKFPANAGFKDMVNGFMVRSILYNKKGAPVSQRDLSEFKQSADPKYFDLSGFKVNDVLGLL